MVLMWKVYAKWYDSQNDATKEVIKNLFKKHDHLYYSSSTGKVQSMK